MRVLQLIDSLHPGGAERVASSYANALLGQVDGSFLCATRAEGDLKKQLKAEVGYLFLAKKSSLDLAAIRRLVRFCKKHRIDVIHAHTTSFFTATLVKLLLRQTALIWHDHYGKSEELEQRPVGVLKWCSRFFDTILSVNQGLVVWAQNTLNCNKVVYFKNAVPLLDPELVNKVDLPGEEGSRILLLANLRPQKDHINAIRAVKMLRADYPGLSLHLLGMHWDNDYYHQLMLHFDEPEGRQFIYYHGSHQNVNDYIKTCDIGLLSSNSEGLPMALLEYAAMGLPVVCTKVGQCAEVIKDDGYLVAPEDSKQLAAGLKAALDHPVEAKNRAKKLRERVEADYSIKSIIPKLPPIYASSR